jgi:putative colanic acid biosynthesis UDP-glucose lipid carrier transferase
MNNLIYGDSSLKVGKNRHLFASSNRYNSLKKAHNVILKRAFDIIVSLVVILCLLSWMVPVLSLLIKLDSPGPVFFRQKRTGYNNREFTCLKFRSMCVNCDADKKQATKNDIRISRIGKILRKTNLDEFPQFFNVLLGEMSVVGPRPHMLSHTDYYSKKIDKYMMRHSVLPGITGYAQVMGARGETKRIEDMWRRVEYDIWYLKNWSFLLDIKIILLTGLILFRGDKNAY